MKELFSESQADGSGLLDWTDQPDPRQLLRERDPEIYTAIESERQRQTNGIELIASENYVFPEVLAAAGSVLTNKYAEGYPGRRYYGGCQYVDVAERIGIERALALFGAEHANVQPHSGAQANAAVYMALLKPGDTVLAMKLDHGGHLSHGFHLNSSGHYYNFAHYGLDPETEQLDYGVIRQAALELRPKLLLVGASAYPRHFDFQVLRDIADEAGCLLMMDMAHVAGLVAAKLHPDPVPYCDVVTTTTHKTLRGPRGGLILCRKEHARAIDRAVFPGIQGGPLMHIIAAKAVGFKLAQAEAFKRYQQQILDNAQALSNALQAEGLRSVSGGTDNHLLLVDLNSLDNEEINGKLVETALDNASIHCNKNMIPFDTRKAMVTSGIRLGTPAATTRGMKQVQFEQIGRWIASIAHEPKDTALQESVRDEVLEMVKAFPVPA
ncbi:MAG: serine hydroxymethyltransferase [Caldilineaceae bacterium]|nr:serine hydroxymethyltransferase [Caldilineaceae bacterium]